MKIIVNGANKENKQMRRTIEAAHRYNLTKEEFEEL